MRGANIRERGAAGHVRVGEGLGIGVWLETSGWVRAWGLVCGWRCQGG